MTAPQLRPHPPAGPRRLPRSRRRLTAALAAGLLVGLAVLLAWSLRPSGGPRQAPPAFHPPVMSSDRVQAGPASSLPGRLDAQWAAVSAASTCSGWAGGDGISAVRLSATQVAWFFSDTYLGPAGPVQGFRRAHGLVHNSVVVETDSGQSRRYTTLTGGNLCSLTGHPASVVATPRAPGRPSTRYWAAAGLKAGDSVFQFYNRFSPGNVPYVPLGTVIARYPVAELAAAGKGAGGVTVPPLTALPYYVPPGAASPIVWGNAILQQGSTVYVYGTLLPSSKAIGRQAYLARVPAAELTDFGAWRFYAGSGQWAGSQQDAAPLMPVINAISFSTAFSVVSAGGRYWLIQADPIAGSQDIDAYPADAPWGPFGQDRGTVLYRDPGIGPDAAHDFRLLYEARAEPAVSAGGQLVISYNVNSIGNSAGCVPMSWFTNTVTLPRFISLPLSALGGHGLVTAGPSEYPRVAARDPDQWFNEWDYKDGCPPIKPLTGLSARPHPGGTVALGWPDIGLGLAYQVYLKPPGAAAFTLRATVTWDLASPARPVALTLSGLAPGRYQVRVVPLNLKGTKGNPATVTFTVPRR